MVDITLYQLPGLLLCLQACLQHRDYFRQLVAGLTTNAHPHPHLAAVDFDQFGYGIDVTPAEGIKRRYRKWQQTDLGIEASSLE
ncbi:hypothetical protein D3C84_794450 [compost metagenome]